MFHVNHYRCAIASHLSALDALPLSARSLDSLADTELGEDGAEHLLDVDAARQAAEMAGGDAELLGLDFRPSPLLAEAAKGLRRGLELGPVAGAGDHRRLASGKPLLGAFRKQVNEFGHALAGLGRQRNAHRRICADFTRSILFNTRICTAFAGI